MKKLFLLCLLASFFTSCVTAPPQETQIVKNEEKSVEVMIHKQLKASKLLDMGFGGLAVIITNKSETPITVIWDKSSIAVNQQTDNVFISGQKFINSGTSSPPITIAKGNKKEVGIYSASSISHNAKANKWEIKGIPCTKGDSIDLSLFIESGEDSFFMTTTWSKEDIY